MGDREGDCWKYRLGFRPVCFGEVQRVLFFLSLACDLRLSIITRPRITFIDTNPRRLFSLLVSIDKTKFVHQHFYAQTTA